VSSASPDAEYSSQLLVKKYEVIGVRLFPYIHPIRWLLRSSRQLIKNKETCRVSISPAKWSQREPSLLLFSRTIPLMHNLKERIAEERARIMALDSRLDAADAPIAKQKLRLALNLFDDLKSAFGGDSSKAEWQKLATFNLQLATKRRQEVEVATHNGADGIVEI
jgi:hypothetical protein